jgi:rod shape-determining protein MreC
MTGTGWRLGRGRGRQYSLVVCAVLAVVIALLGKAEAAIFDSARAKIADFTAPVLAEVRAPLAAFERWVSGVSSFFTVYQENMQLRQENAELRKWQNVALSLESRMRRYEVLLNAVPEPELPSVTARVIGESNRPFVKTMILNAGANQDVAKGEAVLDDRGLIGRIYLTGERSSWVILLTDLNSRVPVVIEPSHRRAILSGDNTPSPQLEPDVGDGAIKAGDRVLSTGDGGLVPPGLPVGIVTGEGDSLRVALFAKADASDFVHVVQYNVPAVPPAGAVPPAVPRAEENAATVGSRQTALARPQPVAPQITRPIAQPGAAPVEVEQDR